MRKWVLSAGTAALMVNGLALADAESTSKSMSFEQCQAMQANVTAQLNVPPGDIEHIVNTSILTMTRIYTDDGSVLITCSDPDHKMVITRSSKGR